VGGDAFAEFHQHCVIMSNSSAARWASEHHLSFPVDEMTFIVNSRNLTQPKGHPTLISMYPKEEIDHEHH
jgi:hypothetical protein